MNRFFTFVCFSSAGRDYIIDRTKKFSLENIHEQLKSENPSGFLALTDDIVHIVMHKTTSEVLNTRISKLNLIICSFQRNPGDGSNGQYDLLEVC